MKERDRLEILFEDMSGKFDAILEYVQLISGKMGILDEHTKRLSRLEGKVDFIMMVVKQHSEKLAEHDTRFDGIDDRLTRLEKRFDHLETRFEHHAHMAMISQVI